MSRVFFVPTLVILLAFSARAWAAQPKWGSIRVALTESPSGKDIPAKVVLLDAETEERVRLVGQTSNYCAFRPQAAYMIGGRVDLAVLPGTYVVVAGRGMEYSIARKKVTVSAGQVAQVEMSLVREVDTTGYVAADLHLHTLTFSGHGDSLLEERLISLAGEGVEFAVATDHNHVTDYRPIAKAVKVDRHVHSISGNEVTTKTMGHFNAYPLDPAKPPVRTDAKNVRQLLRWIRKDRDVKVVQLNHPRWPKFDYFAAFGLDPETGLYGEEFEASFDAMEIMNGNKLMGWDDEPKSDVRKDWYNLLNRGLRFTAVGNSDSHTVWKSLAGVPRNYIASSQDDPTALDTDELIESILKRRVTVSSGLFVTMEVNGEPMGGEVSAPGGRVEVLVSLRASSWLKAEKVDLVVNGETVKTLNVPPPADGAPTFFKERVMLELPRDGWIIAAASGPQVTHPLYPKPLGVHGVTNPVWVDADGDGRFTPPVK